MENGKMEMGKWEKWKRMVCSSQDTYCSCNRNVEWQVRVVIKGTGTGTTGTGTTGTGTTGTGITGTGTGSGTGLRTWTA